MDVIQLPNGNLLVPESALADDGQLIGDGYVEIGPADAEYERLAARALTEEQLEERRRRWQEGDAELQRQFAEYRDSLGVAPGPVKRPGLTASRAIPLAGRFLVLAGPGFAAEQGAHLGLAEAAVPAWCPDAADATRRRPPGDSLRIDPEQRGDLPRRQEALIAAVHARPLPTCCPGS